MTASVQQISALRTQSTGSTKAMEKVDDNGEGPEMTASVQQISTVRKQSPGSTTATEKDDNNGKGILIFFILL